MLFIILLLFFVLLTITIVLFFLPKPLIKKVIVKPGPSSPYSVREIENLFRNHSEYGGLLVTTFNVQFINCDTNNVPDLSDIETIIQLYNKPSLISKNAVDLTYFRNDLRREVFGSLISKNDFSQNKSLSFQIGLLLNVKKLFPYIACMYPLDSGSIARYGDTGGYADSITDNDITQDYNNLLQSKKGIGLTQAGCGIYNTKMVDEPDMESIMITNKNEIQPIPTVPQIYSGWSYTEQKAFSRNLWNDWIEYIKKLEKPLKKIGKNFLKLQLNDKNGHRENEVDIFVPSDTTIFSRVWKESVMGVFTNDICTSDVMKKLKGKIYTNPNDCCSYSKNRELVKALVLKINQNNQNSVGGYFIKTINPSESI